MNFYGRISVGFSGVISLISLSGSSRFALSSVCVGCLVVLRFLPFGVSFVDGFSPPAGDVHSSHLFLYMISGRV